MRSRITRSMIYEWIAGVALLAAYLTLFWCYWVITEEPSQRSAARVTVEGSNR